jgi:undecaprenyl-diphosphatase
LIITNRLLGLDAEEPIRDEHGQLVWFKPPSAEHPEGIPLTVKLAADTYIVVLQIGAIFAVAFLYWRRLHSIANGLMGGDAHGLLLLRNLLLAFAPVVVAGLALENWIETHLFSVPTVIAALVVGALLMLAAERWRRLRAPVTAAATDLHALTVRQSLVIGFMQCLALWPGMSRSMSTMVGGYVAGLTPARAAEFSFLVGLPVLAGAALYKGWKSGPAMVAVFGWTEMLIGAAVAALSAAAAVTFLIGYLSKRGLGVFAVYRLLLAAVLAAWYYL